MNKNNKYLVEVLKDGTWLIVGTNRTEGAANKTGAHAMKLIRGQAYRVVTK